MTRLPAVAGLALWVALGGQITQAQDLTRYRGYALEGSLDAVIATSGLRPADAKVRTERPARIQELEWRAPYVGRGVEMADPVQTLTFMFYNDALYKITASYDRTRVEGLSTADIVSALSATYGTPLAGSGRAGARRLVDVPPDMVLLAAWESESASMLLLRGGYSSDLRLILVSKALALRAKSAISEGARLDEIEAPRREAERRKQESVDADAARSKTRETNKAAFRP
jgi:hypothetical protein